MLTMMWMSSREVHKSEGMRHHRTPTRRVYRVLLWSHESNHAPLSDKNNVKGILVVHECRRLFFIRLHTFIFVIGTSASATRDRRLGSNWRQCNEDVAIAKSSSSRLSRVNKKGSVPVKEI